MERLKRGWSVEDALTKGIVENSKEITCNGTTKRVIDWAKDIGISSKLINRRLRDGWTEEEALFGKKRYTAS